MMRLLVLLTCVFATVHAHTDDIETIDAGDDTITLTEADLGIQVGTEVTLIDATGQTCASAVGATTPLVVTAIDGVVLFFAEGSIVNSDDAAATNCKLTRDVSPVPGAVAGEEIYFTNVDHQSFKISWTQPDHLGDYSADIVGYDIQIASVCQLDETEELVYANRVPTHLPADFDPDNVNDAMIAVTQGDAYAEGIFTGLEDDATDEHGVSGSPLATGDQLLSAGRRTIGDWSTPRPVGPWAQARKVSYMHHVAIPGASTDGAGGSLDQAHESYDSTGAHSLFEAPDDLLGWRLDNMAASPMLDAPQPSANCDDEGAYNSRSGVTGCSLPGTGASETIVDTITGNGGTSLARLKPSDGTSACSTTWGTSDPVVFDDADDSRTNWVPVTGVYTPKGGQDFSKQCIDDCTDQACGSLSDPVEQCGACYPRDAITEADISDSLSITGCFPGATGFPTEPDTSHTINLPGAEEGSYYVVRVRAYNQFGQGSYGTQSYPVQLSTSPTEPLDLAVGNPAANSEYSASPTGVTLTWSAPLNFATGTDDCSGSADAAAVTPEQLRCSAWPTASIAVDCGMVDCETCTAIDPADDSLCAGVTLDGAAVTCTGAGGGGKCEYADGTNCNSIAATCLNDYYDCDYDAGTETISSFACTTNGYGAATIHEAKCDDAMSDAVDACENIVDSSAQACAAGGMHCTYNADGDVCVATVSQAFCDTHAAGCIYLDGACKPTKFYTVYQRISGSLQAIATTYENTYDVAGLEAGNEYEFTITMTNVVGESDHSEELLVKTPPAPGIPVAPRIVSVQSVADGAGSSIALDWTDSLQAVDTDTPITGYRLWAQSKDGFTFATAKDCTAKDLSNAADVAACDLVNLASATVETDCTDNAECEYTPPRAAGSTDWLPAARVYDFDTDDAPVSVSIDFQDDDIMQDRTAEIMIDGSAELALEILSVSDQLSAISGVVPGATVTNLRTATEYRFAIQFVSAAGDGAVSAFSSSITTLEEPISDVRIMSGPPCVFEVPAPTTFAAASAGTNVRYSWELVYNANKGNAALNNDNTDGANDFNQLDPENDEGVCVPTDATLCADIDTEEICTSTGDRGGINPGECEWASGACVPTDLAACIAETTQADCENAGKCTFHNALSAGDTPGVMSGSIIAGCTLGDGSDDDCSANCKNSVCSVMEYTIPLPGFDDAVPDYDEMEIRVIAYNKRGMVRESVVFGWTPRTGDGDDYTENYQTIEYCGCTEPGAANYWQLATYSLPSTCNGVEMWDNAHTAAGHMLSTVLKDEFEYYQFHYDHTATEVEVTVRLDDGAVDVYVGSDGIATPGATSTYSEAETGVTSYYVKTIPYWQLEGSSSLYITVKGASTGGAFARYKVMAKANTFRSFSCDTAATDPHCTGGEDDTGAGESTIYRAVLTEGVLVSDKVVPTYYYHFYEFAYPRAPNDIDVELQVGCSVGQVKVFASKMERYPSDERAVDSNTDGSITSADNPGYWSGSSHTGTVSAGDTTNFMYTMKPQAHADSVSSGHGGLLHFSVKGIESHAPGEFLPSSTYSIKAKVYRYRVESELLDLVGGLAEERRYSVVTLDNFNYYEVRLSPSTSAVTINLQVHYGEASLYRSKSTLPTQDSSSASEGGGADAAWDQASESWVTTAVTSVITAADGAQAIDPITSGGLNLVDGYVYFGLICRTAECSYDLSVELTQLNSGASPTTLYNCGGGIVSTSASCLDDSGAALSQSSFGLVTSLEQDETYYYKFHISEYENVDMYVTERDGSGTPVADDELTSNQDTWGVDWTETLVSTWVDDFSDELNLDVDVAIETPSDATIYVSASDPYPSSERGTQDTFDLDDATSLVATFEDVATFSRTWLYFSITPVNSDLATDSIRITPTENVPESATTQTVAVATCMAETCAAVPKTGTMSDPLTLQASNDHSTSSDYYAGWSIATANPAGTGIITASSAADPPVLTVDWQVDITTTDATTYELKSSACGAVVLYSSGSRDLAGTAATCTDAGDGEDSSSGSVAECEYVADSCTNHGSCISGTEGDEIYCICDEGWFDGPTSDDTPNGKCSVASSTSGGLVGLAASFSTGVQESGTMSDPLTLEVGQGHSTSSDYYAGWSIATANPAGSGIITASSAADPPVLTVDWDASVDPTTTDATTYKISIDDVTVCENVDVTCTIDEIVPAVSATPDATGKVSTLYDALTEVVELDCRVDSCKPTGTPGQVGYVSCTDSNTACTMLVPQPMMTVSMSVTAAPEYSKIRAYMNGKPYPRAGANTFVQAAAGDYTTDLKVYSLPPSSKEHTLNLVLTTDNGDPLAISTRSFTVDSQGGCGVHIQESGTMSDPLTLQASKGHSTSSDYYAGWSIATANPAGSGIITASSAADPPVLTVDWDASVDPTTTDATTYKISAINDACSGQGVCHSGYCVCFDGYYGSSCENDVADVTESFDIDSSFGANTAYRLRRDALNAEKLASTRFVHKIQLEETTTKLAREQSAMTAKNSEITTKLENDVLTSGSTLNEALKASKSTVDSSVSSIYSKQERNTIRIQQAKQEAARLKTANREAYIDQKRALYAHATAVQNANDAALLVAQQKIAAHNQAIEDNFREGRFIKNQLRTANGPRTAVSDLKTQSCTTDQFFKTVCTDVDYDDDLFAAGARTDEVRTAAAEVDAAVGAERDGATVPR